MTRRIVLAVLATLLLTESIASARVLSYAPYTHHGAVPAIQHRMNRYFALVEPSQRGQDQTLFPRVDGIAGKLVIYDSTAKQPPRAVFPQVENEIASISLAAARENDEGILTLLIQTTFNHEGINPANAPNFFFSSDSGSSWTPIPELGSTSLAVHMLDAPHDTGGPYAHSRFAPVRIGTREIPFVVATGTRLVSVSREGTPRILYTDPLPSQWTFARLAGSNENGTEFLIQTRYGVLGSPREQLVVIGLDSTIRNVTTLPMNSTVEGWITPDGAVYFEHFYSDFINPTRIIYSQDSANVELITIESQESTGFAIPSHDYAGAWIVSRSNGKPTILYRHTPEGGMVRQWEDATAPPVEALHAGESGTRLLLQVPKGRRQIDGRLFIDPTLAIWRAGDPAPRTYDELFLNSEKSRGFVHLDVDRVDAGGPFVFDAGVSSAFGYYVPGIVGDRIVQEWGVVRSSLEQRLVLPGVARSEGAYGAFWVSDLIIRNPLNASQNVRLRFASEGGAAAAPQNLSLGPREIRLVSDVLKTLFGLERGGGSIIIEPETAVAVTSRTFSRSNLGSYGFGIDAVDASSAPPNSRLASTYSGAFPHRDFRTNVTFTDPFDSGAISSLEASTKSGAAGRSDLTIRAAPAGQGQVNNLRDVLGLAPWETGALMIGAEEGSGIASVITIDNMTNDATYYGPDLPARTERCIPMIAHQAGANGADYRSDLYLFNTSTQPREISLRAKTWDQYELGTALVLTLQPNEARVIEDVLLTAFGKTGAARLRYSSPGSGPGVRGTSRTYSLSANGGTYGFPVPPLDNSQIGGAGDTLEILGAVADSTFRTNIGLVEMTEFPNPLTASVKVEIIASGGAVADSFVVTLPSSGGMQINDVFRARSINVDGPVLIRISPQSGIIGAYAAMIDNRTNDATYLSANLGSSE